MNFKRTAATFILFATLTFGATTTFAEETTTYHIVTNQHELIHNLAEQGHLTIAEHFDVVGSYVIEMTDTQKKNLSTHFPEARIHPEQIHSISADRVPGNLTQIQTAASFTSPYTGRGVKVGVLDSGIDTEHRDLKVVGGVCTYDSFCSAGVPYDDDEGHGTHVAGIIAALANGTGVVGVAPNVELYSIKALSEFGSGTTTSIVRGIEWAIQNDLDILNLSITSDENEPAIANALKVAYDKGMILVGAAGNKGVAETSTVTYPAKYDTVIAVGAVTSKNTKLLESSVGPEVEFTAPGEQILSTYPMEWDFTDDKADGYTMMSGTSMAAPHVTGLLALYKERFPDLTNKELRTLLVGTVTDLGTAGRDRLYGHGLISYKKVLPGYLELTTTVSKSQLTVTSKEPARLTSITIGSTKYPISNGKSIVYGVKGNYSVAAEWNKDGKTIREMIPVSLTEPDYKDVRGDSWYARHIGFLHYKDQIEGFLDGTFRPQAEITRAQAITLIARAKGLDGAQRKTEFPDVNPASFASGYIQSAVEAGITGGYTDGTFRPDKLVTRAEMAILVQRAFSLPTPTTANPFTDVTSGMASYNAIRAIVAKNVTTGFSDKTFRPYQPMTRSEYAAFLARVQQ
ncbi:S8 family serine peptidase [Chryseomicrobium palamuruense]|uniref:S8 family serine peptidase n=1 Tax=Chryseomicrobium palamuruense TaxID=682973 RepID=A0ABV8UUN3_9BACL